MKKSFVLFAILILVAGAAFAATPLKFSGTYALFGNANGRTIRKATVDLDESGVVIATGKEEAAAYNDNFTLFLGGNTLAVISNRDGLAVYVLYGQATLAKDGSKTISLYTPTTYSKLIGKGEYAVVSTDTEELFFNFSRFSTTPYDALRNESISVPQARGYDYLQRKLIDLDYTYAVTAEKAEEAARVPAAPIMLEVTGSITADPRVPGIPVMKEVIQAIQTEPKAPEGLVFEQSIVPEGPAITVTQTLVYVPEKPSFALEPITELVND